MSSIPRLVAIALVATCATALHAQQQPKKGAATYRVRITITDGEPEPAGGSPLRYDEEVVGTIARDDGAPANEPRYVGHRLTRRLSGAYRGMTAGDPGEICVWTLDATGLADVTLRGRDDAWDLGIESRPRDATIRASSGSCPASQVQRDTPFIATTVMLEGPVPIDPSTVYRYDGGTRRISLAIIGTCDDTDVREGPKDARSESVRSAVAGGLNAAGAATGPDVVAIRNTTITEFNVRLGPKHEPLPSRACLEERIKAGEIGAGALQGATHMLAGGVQESGGETRVTVRVTDITTGAVVATGKADAAGPDAIGSATREAIAQLGWQFAGGTR